MEQANKGALPSNKQGIIFGVITGIAMVVFNLIIRWKQVPQSSVINFFVLAIYLIGVLAFCFLFSKNDANDTEFKGMFKGAFRMVAIVTIVLLAAALINVAVDPSLKKEILDNNLAALEAAKKTPAEIDEAMKLSRDKFTLMIVMNTVFANIFYGVVFAAIGAAIFRKNKV